MGNLKRSLLFGLGLILLILIGIIITSHFITELMWFNSLGYSDLITTRLTWEWGVKVGVWLVATLFLFINLMFTRIAVKKLFNRFPPLGSWIKDKYIILVVVLGSLFLGLIFSSGLGKHYLEVAKFFNAQSFNFADPIFNKDLSFYFFSLPLFQLLVKEIISILTLALIVCGIIYFLAGSLSFENRRLVLASHVKKHLSILVGLIFLTKGISFYLNGFNLLFEPSGAVFGAGYTDIHVRLVVLKILIGLTFLVGIIFLTQLYTYRKLVLGAFLLWLTVSLVGGGFLPQLVQSWLVEPNEFTRERPYIEYHIAMTRKAYGLDEFVETNFPVSEELTWEDIETSQTTINNIRLWDPRLILQTYGQLQEMRPYYLFSDADVGRYWVDGEYREVLLSARELDVSLTQNRNWLNDHLQYTHGYGVVVSPVNEVSRQQMPIFWMADIPPKGKIDLEITQPRIYFGERTNEYAIVNTLIEEFDYPTGEGNAYYNYQGQAGIEISSLLHRLLFAVRFGTSRIMLSNDITSESRIIFYRNIKERINKIAPFLRFDNDPYIVISDKGNLFWIIDAYTVSSRFPYADPTPGWGNYIRNSVKVVVDAYNGSVGFYQVEPDPLLETYSEIFPGWLQQLSDMPEGIQAHLRYPEDFLAIQAQIYGTYHMQDTRVFYNREDVWVLAREIYAEREQEVVPYYVVMQLAKELDPELLLMIPFTPVRRNNMIAWLAARNDGENYGQVVVYHFPKDSLTLGPAQIDATIDQDSEISQLLSLWGQRGSQVIRGNLLVLPIKDSILYVEPLFLQSEQSSMPQLQRVIVAHQDKLVMEQTIEKALEVLFRSTDIVEAEERDKELNTVDRQNDGAGDLILDHLGEHAFNLYKTAEQALKDGDFATFGEAWVELESVLNRLINE